MNSIARSLLIRIPPHTWFIGSAVFHYLGPSFAVLLFPAVGVLGVALFRIANAALIFAPVTRPDRIWRRAGWPEWRFLIALSVCLAVINCSFYLALDRLLLSLVAAIEFVGTVGRAAHLAQRDCTPIDGSWRAGVARYPLVVGPCRPGRGVSERRLVRALYNAWAARQGIGRLGTAMAIAFVIVLPTGFAQAFSAAALPALLLAGIGVGICSSVIPYICDQLAMAQLPLASFAMMLALLPATATVIGAVVLDQIPSASDLIGIALVMGGVALHRKVARG